MFGFVLFFCIESFGLNIPAEILAYLQPSGEGSHCTCELYYAINDFVCQALSNIGLADFLAADYAVYVLLGSQQCHQSRESC